jgi:hypothetical protein
MDLIKIRKSFLSNVTLDTKVDGHHTEVHINESSVGFLVNISGQSSLVISSTIVPPLSHVTRSVSSCASEEKTGLNFKFHYVFLNEAITMVFYVMSFFCFAATLLPSYVILAQTTNSGSSVWIFIAMLAISLVMQTLCWVFVVAVLQLVAQVGSRQTGTPWSNAFYAVFLTANFALQNWSCMRIFHGSSTYNFLIWVLGGKFKGQALVFPRSALEYSFITFENKAIIFNANLNGHYVVYNNFKLGPSRVYGVTHDGCYVANALLNGEERGPWRSYVGTYGLDGAWEQHWE